MAAPTKRIEDMTEEEKLQSMREFAEEQKYVRPGDEGTIPRGPFSMMGLAFGGPMRAGPDYESTHHLPPPSYQKATSEEESSHKEKHPGPFKKWLDKRHEKKDAEAKERNHEQNDRVVR